jgi:hypothetical protein
MELQDLVVHLDLLGLLGQAEAVARLVRLDHLELQGLVGHLGLRALADRLGLQALLVQVALQGLVVLLA